MFRIPDLRAFYGAPYDESMLEWRRLGAEDKAAHIDTMLGQRLEAAEGVLEVGCGTGDVSAILARAHPGTRFVGVEIGETRNDRPPHVAALENLAIEQYDGTTLPYEDGAFDVVVATHVLEHVVDERGFLHELRRVSRGCVFVEVPCEQILTVSAAKLQRTLDIGHINCYSMESFALTLETSGLEVQEIRAFDPSRAVQTYHGGRAATLKFAIRRALLTLARPLAPKILSYHVAAVAVPAPKLTIA